MIGPKKALGVEQGPLYGLTATVIDDVLSNFVAGKQSDDAAVKQFADLSEQSIHLRSLIWTWAGLVGVTPAEVGNIFFNGFLTGWRARVSMEGTKEKF